MWRLLGERHPHPAAEGIPEVAGTYYRRDERTWHTFDQVLVDGSLLGSSPPYLDEHAVRIVSDSAVFPAPVRGSDGLPLKFSWNNGQPAGLSDHLPVWGEIVLG